MERAREGAFNHLWSLALPRRGEATVGNMNYEMIRGCKMEINPGDYTAQYLPIRFLRQWFLIVVVWRTASLIIPPVWSAAGEGIVMIEFFWTWLRRQLHFASHFQDFVFCFFFPRLLFLFLILRWQKISTTSNLVCLLFPSPGAPSAAESPRDNKGKDIKAHKQHTPRRKRKSCVCVHRLIHVYADARLCVCACIHTHRELRAFTRCSSVPRG